MIGSFLGCFAVALCFGIMGLVDGIPPYEFFNYGFLIMTGLGIISFILWLIFGVKEYEE